MSFFTSGQRLGSTQLAAGNRSVKISAAILLPNFWAQFYYWPLVRFICEHRIHQKSEKNQAVKPGVSHRIVPFAAGFALECRALPKLTRRDAGILNEY
ncbi:hypothetical protein FHR99_000703 [Litorivivens lipolytica]|uniref:Uncharacterized protein n=1 Tax=Litorivivens lipolytica TaxID=1524264 RepID=A0A7W4W3Z8_9GAMM|nr:hypothetical protein [Litorivivens lipolytica]MBB3046467.1 hypothetical protein [Litorivivens lipolytica]